MEPAHIRSRLEMARVYFELKEFDAAEAEFDKSSRGGFAKKRKRANTLIQKSDCKRKADPFCQRLFDDWVGIGIQILITQWGLKSLQ